MGELCWQDECGVMGVMMHPDAPPQAAQAVYDGLRLLQHRGQDGTGMVIAQNGKVAARKRLGLVADAYDRSWLSRPASLAIGHNRYATQGPPSALNLQPHGAPTKDGMLYLASNGDIPMYAKIRRRLERQGAQFRSSNDGELLAWFLAKAYDRDFRHSLTLAIQELQEEVEGAYSVVVLFKNHLYAFRDPKGFRPMVRGTMPNGGAVYASESVALDILGVNAESRESVPAGAIHKVLQYSTELVSQGHKPQTPCAFEYIYFARPDSIIEGLPVSFIRRRLGWNLAWELQRIDPEAIVVPVPDSANFIASGFSRASKLPLVSALTRSHTARRTFIEPSKEVRDEGVKYKLNPHRFELEDRVVYLVDDSIVRGTTSHKIVRMLRRAGARKVHLVIGSPPIRWPCFMGIATPTRKELIANSHSVREIAKLCEADSLHYLSLEGLKRSVGPIISEERRRMAKDLKFLLQAQPLTLAFSVLRQLEQQVPERHCFACFTGKYPIAVPSSKT